MTNDSDDLLARFRALPPEEQARLLAGRQGAPAMQDANAGRDVNVATNQTITNLAIALYGPDPELPRRERLARYLDRLAARTAQLPLHGLDATLDKGDGITLDRIYVMLATESLVEVARGEPAQLRRYFAELPPDVSELAHDRLVGCLVEQVIGVDAVGNRVQPVGERAKRKGCIDAAGPVIVAIAIVLRAPGQCLLPGLLIDVLQ